MINKEFIPYDLRTIIIELGYNYDAVCYHRSDMKNKPIISEETATRIHGGTDCLNHPAILYQQAFKFFRDKYNAHHSITRLPQGALDADAKNNKLLKKYAWFISKDDLNPTIPQGCSNKCDTYEEAELECLKKLIEIVKNK